MNEARSRAQRLTGKASLTEKLTGFQHPDDAFLALLRYYCDLNLAGPNVEDCIGRVALKSSVREMAVRRAEFTGILAKRGFAD